MRRPPLRLLLPALLVLWLAATVAAQTRVPLDGEWQLALEAQAGGPGAFDRGVAVPAAFETALGVAFDGVAWYRRALPLQPQWRGAAVRIEFAAVATEARVRCNGQDLGEHLGGWTPFRVDVTKALHWDGNDAIEVRVDEKVGHDTQGFLPIVQPHFGGIWQPVTLCIDQGPLLDRLTLSTFGRLGYPTIDLNGLGSTTENLHAPPPDGTLLVGVAVLPAAGRGADRLRVQVLDGSAAIAASETPVREGAQTIELAVPHPRPWESAAPHLYTARITAMAADGATLDQVDRRVGFRSLCANGTTIVWNGTPLQVRGVLHWGYSPPHLAPPCDPAFWRRQLEDFRSLGFNTLKCCLWVPPPCVYDLCDEIGLLCWQEYPTWHSHLDQAHKQQLLDEYAGFFAQDRSHPSVAFRSITCETGQGADLDVVSSLFKSCKAAVPDTLVVDDSSWLGWQRITDFWDEHPYGNNRWWPGRLAEFQKFLAEHEAKPLLLGECIAADTWVDLAEWQRRAGDAPPWWRPDCLQDQTRFEAWVKAQFGDEVLQSLAPLARDYGMRTRRYQIERLRATIPQAGYVVSVARDFGKARMGLYDDFDRLKWSGRDWAWHGQDMLCLDGSARAFVVGDQPVLPTVRAVHGTAVSAPVALPPLPHVTAPTRHRLEAAVDEVAAAWDVWLLPPFDDARPTGVRVADHLDTGLLDFVEGGGRLLLRVGGASHCLRSEPMWYLRGAPWAPPHPVHAALPLAMLLQLQPFDLDGGRVMPWAPLQDQVDPILAFWETHDIAEVKAHLFAFDTRVGQGRILASAFDRDSDAGRYVERALLHHLADGPAPQRAWSDALRAALRQLFAERTIPLPTWRFRTDPDDQGRKEGWQRPETDAASAPWRDLAAGLHWENQAKDLEHYTGIAWYRIDLEVPADWPPGDARAVFEGVDDSFECFLDGESLGSRGDPATGVTIWLETQVIELGARLRPGRHVLVLRVVDHGGAGGLWKPAYVTTGPVGPIRTLLQ